MATYHVTKVSSVSETDGSATATKTASTARMSCDRFVLLLLVVVETSSATAGGKSENAEILAYFQKLLLEMKFTI